MLKEKTLPEKLMSILKVAEERDQRSKKNKDEEGDEKYYRTTSEELARIALNKKDPKKWLEKMGSFISSKDPAKNAIAGVALKLLRNDR